MMWRSNLIAVLLLAALPGTGQAQSLLDQLDEGIVVQELDDVETSIPVPVEIIQTPPPLSDVADGAILRGLDRINGTVGSFPIRVGETVTFERLEVTLLACRYPKGDISADGFAELTVRDVREDAPRFTGWMFASSPAVSALDHPRYDIWVLSCRNSSEVSTSGTE